MQEEIKAKLKSKMVGYVEDFAHLSKFVKDMSDDLAEMGDLFDKLVEKGAK